MNDDRRQRVSLSKDAVQLIRGLVIGELVTILIIGGLWLWLRPRLFIAYGASSSSNQSTDQGSGSRTSTFKTLTNIPSGSFNYGGSTAWAPIRQLVDSQIQSTRPELHLHYVHPTDTSPGSGSGIRMLLNGQLDFTESSRPLTAKESAMAQQQGFDLVAHQVGTDGIAVVVNPALKVSGLTIDQLQQIYQGHITNWKQVGGPDLLITPFSQKPENADTAFPPNQVLEKQELGSNVEYVYSTTEALRRVHQTPGGLYFASAPAVVPQCMVKPLPIGRTSTQFISPYREPLVPLNQCPLKRNQVNTEAIKNGSYPLIAKLFVIVKQNKSREQQAGEAYTRLLLSDQGQKEIEQAGFIPIR
jgi:phosphate transport system substrate-binding protein